MGIDPGLSCTGWGIIQQSGHRLSFIACGVIATKKEKMEDRLVMLHHSLRSVIDTYSPVEVSIEETFMNTNPASSLKLGHARGALLLTVALTQKPLYSYAAREIKKAVVGTGAADKEQIGRMVSYLLPQAVLQGPDSADALAIAICHAHTRRTTS